MEFGQWLTKFDPTSFSFTVLVYMIVIASIAFIWFKLWPHYVKESAPARIRLQEMERTAKIDMEKQQLQADIDKDKRQTEVLASIRDALLEIKILSAQMGASIQKQEDTDIRNFNAVMQRLERLDFTAPKGA